MFRLGAALVGFIGLLLAQGGSVAPPVIEYFYQNEFLSDTANVVLEFTVKDCVPKDASYSGTIDFGDGKSEPLTRITCGRWRVPHTYFANSQADQGPKTYTATLDLSGTKMTAAVDISESMPVPAPAPLEGGPNSGGGSGNNGGGGGGGGQPKPAPKPEPVQAEYLFILTKAPKGLSGFIAQVSVPEGEITDIKPEQLKKVFKDEGLCPSPNDSGACQFRGYLSEGETFTSQTEIRLATILVKQTTQPPACVKIVRAQDLGPNGRYDGSDFSEIPPGDFKIISKKDNQLICTFAS